MIAALTERGTSHLSGLCCRMNTVFSIAVCHRCLALKELKRLLFKDKQAVSKTESQHCPPHADVTMMHLRERAVEDEVAGRRHTRVMNCVSSRKHFASVIRRQKCHCDTRRKEQKGKASKWMLAGLTFSVCIRLNVSKLTRRIVSLTVGCRHEHWFPVCFYITSTMCRLLALILHIYP